MENQSTQPTPPKPPSPLIIYYCARWFIPRRQNYDVVHGDLNKWHDRLRVTVPYRSDANEVASLRSRREKQYGSVGEIFKKWQQNGTSFKLSVQEEAQALGRAIIETFATHITKCMAYSFGLETPQSPLEWLPPPATALVFDMFRILEEYKISNPLEQLQKSSYEPRLRASVRGSFHLRRRRISWLTLMR
jgi:hypothetical protein